MLIRVAEPTISQVTRAVAAAVDTVIGPTFRKATKYLHPAFVVSACRRHRKVQQGCMEIMVKVGKPNSRQRDFIRACIKAKERFPVRRIQYQYWPEKKKRRKA